MLVIVFGYLLVFLFTLNHSVRSIIDFKGLLNYLVSPKLFRLFLLIQNQLDFLLNYIDLLLNHKIKSWDYVVLFTTTTTIIVIEG